MLILYAFMIYGCVQLITKLDGEAVYLTVLSIISLVLAFYHIAFNNLLTNLRFRCCSRRLFDWTGYLILYPLFKIICSDRPGKFCAIKWVFKYAYFGVLIGLIKWQKSVNPKYDTYSPQEDNIMFDNLLIIYLLQIPIFIVLRPIFFTIWVFMTCCFG